MTREEAIRWLSGNASKNPRSLYGQKIREATDVVLNALSEQRKTGRWIAKQRGNATDVWCSLCNEIRFKDYSWGYTAEEIQAKIDDDMEMPKFCENCGAKMEGAE